MLYIGLFALFFLRKILYRIFIFNYLVWKDFIKAYKAGDYKKFNGFGVTLYVGLYGQGKTLSAVEYALRMKKKYGDTIKIYTNFSAKFSDGFIDTWQDILDAPSNSIIIIDEVQNSFNSRKWNSFPEELLRLMTQNRKSFKKLLFTAQRYTHVDKSIRDLANEIVECRCLVGRWVFQKAFDRQDYELGNENDNIRKRHRKWRYNFIAYDDIRTTYDTYEIVGKLKSTDFKTKKEKVVENLSEILS